MRPGTLVAQNVRLVRLLGEGGMGQVWLADHLTLNTKVAVKFMSDALAADAGARARFSAEAAAAAQLKSPHIVQMFDRGLVDGRPFIIMELLSGESLEARLSRDPPLSVEEVATIVRQTCKGLHRAYQVGIVHRDIKPENLFLTTDDEGEICVKILDFGIARREGEDALKKTATGSMIGTPLYMSPEQIKNPKALDHRSDLWSLGVVAYRALTGRLPFDGETAGAIFIAIDRADPPPPSSLRPDVGAGVDAWMARALAKDPAERFQTAREMSDALMTALTPESERLYGSLAPLSKTGSASFASVPVPRGQRRAPRSRFLRPVLAILAALALLAVAGLVLRLMPARPSAVGIVQSPPVLPPPTPRSTSSTSTPTPTPTSTPTSTPTATASSTATPTVSPQPRKKKDRGF
jgi:serine/threonine-protein kinase